MGVFIFSFLCLIGSATFAAGTFLRGKAALLPVMLLGRLLFGSGNGSLTSQFCILLIVRCQLGLSFTWISMHIHACMYIYLMIVEILMMTDAVLLLCNLNHYSYSQCWNDTCFSGTVLIYYFSNYLRYIRLWHQDSSFLFSAPELLQVPSY